jgi:hypothetical protein
MTKSRQRRLSRLLRGPDGRLLKGPDGRALTGRDGRALRNWRGEALSLVGRAAQKAQGAPEAGT